MSDRAEQRIGVATFRNSVDAPATRAPVVRTGGAMSTKPPTQREIRIVYRSMQHGMRLGMKRGIALGFVLGAVLGALVALFIVSVHRSLP